MIRKKWLMILMVFALLGFVFSLGANTDSENQEIAKIQKAIKDAGLSWQAGETSMTRLSPEERSMRLGALKNNKNDFSQDTPEKISNKIEPLAALPATLDWRNNGGNWVTSIKNQGSCGSCWTFATAGILESIVKIGKNIKTDLDLSEQTLLSCSGAGYCSGGYTYKASNYCRTTGIPRENCFPYSATDAACNPCNNWQSKTALITSYVEYDNRSAEVLKTALQDGPISSFMEIYNDFYSYKSGIYERTAGSADIGGHAIVIIGYNANQNYWICKNSWGTDWGENGFFKIRMGNSQIGTWCVSMSGPIIKNKPPVLKAIPAQSVDEGINLAFNLSATDSDYDTLIFSGKSLPVGATLDANTGAFSWTPTFTESKVYNISFSVTDGMEKVSKTAKITVINVKTKQW